MHGEVVDEFAVVIKALWSGQYRSITPRDLKVSVFSIELSKFCFQNSIDPSSLRDINMSVFIIEPSKLCGQDTPNPSPLEISR